MQIVLRKLDRDQDPAQGEVLVRPDTGKNAATEALQRGVPGFPHLGVPATVVAPVNPTLDDMLAASILSWKQAGQTLPAGLDVYARYAGIAREGLRPSAGRLEHSIEGVFLAVRNSRDPDLSRAENAALFLADWQRLADQLRKAAEAGKDPFKDDVLADASDFARERAFLAKDHQVYQQDVLRGERWVVTVPQGPPESSALVLRQPKSLLWKYWAREDREAPAGGCYLLTGVEFDAGAWTFSVDPVQRLSLKGLADAFQAAEQAKGADANDPWFDGARFDYTLVSAPRGGTKLSENEVRDVFRKWCNARRPATAHRGAGTARMLAIAAAAGVLITVGVVIAMALAKDPVVPGANNAGPIAGPAEPDFRARGIQLPSEKLAELRSTGTDVRGYALIVGVGDSSYQPRLPAACADAGLLFGLLRDKFGYKPEDMLVLVDEPDRALDRQGNKVPVYARPTRENVSRALQQLAKETGRYPEGDRTNFVFYYAGHGHTFKRADEIGYLVLSDFWETPEDRRVPDTQAYNMGHLARDIRQNIKSSHQMLLIDCCFSGFVTKARGNPKAEPSAIYELWKTRAHVVITAGTADQRAFEVGTSSVFSQTLFRGLGIETERMLADANNDGILTDAELGVWMSEEVPKMFARSARTQTPQYLRGLEELDDVGQFLFLPRG